MCHLKGIQDFVFKLLVLTDLLNYEGGIGG